MKKRFPTESVNEVRQLRVFMRHWAKPVVQYGVWRTQRFSPRFYVYREWPCESREEAVELKHQLELDLARAPSWLPPPEEEPKLLLGWHNLPERAP